MLVYGIPEFRLLKAIVQREVEYLQKFGVEFKTDFVVGKTRTKRGQILFCPRVVFRRRESRRDAPRGAAAPGA